VLGAECEASVAYSVRILITPGSRKLCTVSGHKDKACLLRYRLAQLQTKSTNFGLVWELKFLHDKH
jgi:hypothetical protein